jgi:NADH pyrophosphatase NudC (nudix superfamily)
MISKCPGQDKRNIRPQIIDCPYCGYAVELFSDELKTNCPKCGNCVYKDRLPSCIDWCKSARDCIGEETYREYHLKIR